MHAEGHPGAPVFVNPAATRTAPWTSAQDDILNDRGLDTARATISAWPNYKSTPLHDLPTLAAELGVARLLYKDEGSRFGLGSFKALGGAFAVARLLQSEISSRLGRAVSMHEITDRTHANVAAAITVTCATDGNHGRSVAWGARTFGCNCVIFIHATVSEGRKTAIESFGAEVRRTSGNYDDSVREAEETARREGWFVVSDTSYPGYVEVPKDVMQGYELMADEAFSAAEAAPTHIFLQTGVGGMAAAIAANAVRRWGHKRPYIILCDPDRSACWDASLRAGHPVAIEGDLDTMMAGLACGEVSLLAWEVLKDHADAVMALPDEAAVNAMRRLAFPSRDDPAIVAGESAVAGLAGLTAAMADPKAKAALNLGSESRVLLFGTEGDTDPELYREIIGKSGGEVLAGNAA